MMRASFHTDFRPGDVSRVPSHLGYAPEFSAAQGLAGLREAMAWYHAQATANASFTVSGMEKLSLRGAGGDAAVSGSRAGRSWKRPALPFEIAASLAGSLLAMTRGRGEGEWLGGTAVPVNTRSCFSFQSDV